MKFYESEFSLTKQYADALRKKRDLLKTKSKTKKHIFITLITTYGLAQNQYSLGLIDNVIILEDLF